MHGIPYKILTIYWNMTCLSKFLAIERIGAVAKRSEKDIYICSIIGG
jgi:hypothetical protein